MLLGDVLAGLNIGSTSNLNKGIDLSLSNYGASQEPRWPALWLGDCFDE